MVPNEVLRLEESPEEVIVDGAVCDLCPSPPETAEIRGSGC